MEARFLFLLCVIVNEAYSYDSQPFVHTTSGIVLGKRITVLDKKVNAYLGIPYAVPPLADLRFKKPQPVEQWRGIYQATAKPDACYQKPSPFLPNEENVSEDCLYLNVWVPHHEAKDTAHNSLKVVMVWIYGGAFRGGSSDTNLYDGGVLASYGNVIFASMNYRVGLFGFLATNSEDAPGNMGLWDQRLAIQWIKKNAKNFGGDPNKIIVFGESAGSASVGLQIISPLNKGLFSRGIMQSSAPYNQQLGGENLSVGQSKADKLAKRVGCSSEKQSIFSHPQEVLKCLKDKDPDTLAEAEVAVFPSLLSFLPIYGDDFMPQRAALTVREGDFNHVEVLTGTTSNEAAVFFLYSSLDISKGGLELTKTIFADTPINNYTEISDRYFSNVDFNDRSAVLQAVYDAFGDYIIVCPEVLFSEAYSRLESNIYYYIFDHHPSTAFADNYTGMTHFEDVQFVFGDPLKNPDRYTNKEVELSRFTLDTWLKFAKTGNPITPGVESWPRYNSKDHSLLWIKLDSKTVGQVPNLENCKFWDKLFLQ